MKFIVCAVGHKMPEWVAAGFQEYAKRMPHEASIELLEIKPEKRDSGKKVEQLLAAEGASVSVRCCLPSISSLQWMSAGANRLPPVG